MPLLLLLLLPLLLSELESELEPELPLFVGVLCLETLIVLTSSLFVSSSSGIALLESATSFTLRFPSSSGTQEKVLSAVPPATIAGTDTVLL
jgi:hypothetical protein